MLDRIDLRIEMSRVLPSELLDGPPAEASRVVAQRIAGARQRALRRNGGRPNAALSGSAIVAACQLIPTTRALLSEVAAATPLSARGVHRVLRVARSIADLGQRDDVSAQDVLAAAALHQPISEAGSPAAA